MFINDKEKSSIFIVEKVDSIVYSLGDRVIKGSVIRG